MTIHKICPKNCSIISSAVLLFGVLLFIVKYTHSGFIPLVYDNSIEKNTFLFNVNFYFPVFVSFVSLNFLFFVKQKIIKIILFIVCIFSTSVSVFQINDLLTIQLCILVSPLVYCGLLYFPLNIISFSSALFIYAVSLSHPLFMGGLNIPAEYFKHSLIEYIMFYGIISSCWIVIAVFNKIDSINSNLHDTVQHLVITEKQLTLVNSKLQENTKVYGDKACQEERMRITRDMHDSSGYVYTNIIALSDAAVSMKECDSETTKKLFSFIRTQAEEGLQRTRETLHTIREITTPLSTGINDIYQLKQIFEEVTNIHIQIETGNMKQSYGSVINSSLRKIVQESLVNSLRHGKATKIFIQFWELDNLLTMIVSDNGLGAKQIVKGIGLKGMEERVSILGGTISFSSPEEGGFRLLITIPLVNDTLYEEQGSFNGRT